MYQWCEFKSRRGKNKNLTALKSNSNTVWFNFQTYIYIVCAQEEKYINHFNLCVYIYIYIYIYNIFSALVRKNINVNEHKIPSTLQKLDIWTQIKGAVPVLQVYALHPQ